jgi:hypothetical protein
VESRVIRTDVGNLELTPATIDQLRGIARYWPMGLLRSPDTSGPFGLVFQRGAEEVHGIKLQPVDVTESKASIVHHVNRAVIAAALPYYLEKQHRGVMVPCAYYKKKAPDTVETGIALFVGPDATSKSSSGENADTMYDERLGGGATPMVFDMASAIAKAGKTYDLPLLTVIGVDLRPRLALGGLAMHFLVEGPQVLVVKHPLQEDEPVWKYAVQAGFSTLPYAPMQTAAVPNAPPADTPRA